MSDDEDELIPIVFRHVSYYVLRLDIYESGEELSLRFNNREGHNDSVRVDDTPIRTVLSERGVNVEHCEGVLFNFLLISLLIKHPTKFKEYLEEFASWPLVETIGFSIPRRVPSPFFDRDFIQPLRTFMLQSERESTFKVLTALDANQKTTIEFRAMDFSFTLGFEIAHEEGLTGYPDWISNGNHKFENARDKVLNLFLDCAVPEDISLNLDDKVQANMFEKICSISSLKDLSIWDCEGLNELGKCKTATLRKALTKPSYSLRKRKRTGLHQGSLCQLEKLCFRNFLLGRQQFVEVCKLVETIATVPYIYIAFKTQGFDDIASSDPPAYWNPMLNILRHNNSIQTLHYCADGRNRPIEYPKAELFTVLRDHNTTIHTLEFNTLGIYEHHTEEIQLWLDFNYFGLRSILASTRNSTCTKRATVDALIAAVEKDNRKPRDHKGRAYKRDFFTCLYLVFHEHPQLISFLL